MDVTVHCFLRRFSGLGFCSTKTATVKWFTPRQWKFLLNEGWTIVLWGPLSLKIPPLMIMQFSLFFSMYFSNNASKSYAELLLQFSGLSFSRIYSTCNHQPQSDFSLIPIYLFFSNEEKSLKRSGNVEKFLYGPTIQDIQNCFLDLIK